MTDLKLTYFDAPGRAEPVRVALFMAAMPFEDIRIDFAKFAALRQQGELPLGAVPTLVLDGVTMTQTAAMLRYVARVGNTGLYPSDPKQAFIVDSALESFNDTLSNALMPSIIERDMDKRLAMRATFAAGPMTRVLSYVEGLVAKSGGPFLLGAEMSIADLVIANQVLQLKSGKLDGITPEMLAPYPLLSGLAAAYLAHPRIAEYRAR